MSVEWPGGHTGSRPGETVAMTRTEMTVEVQVPVEKLFGCVQADWEESVAFPAADELEWTPLGRGRLGPGLWGPLPRPTAGPRGAGPPPSRRCSSG